jgi:hypothetical protein
LCLHSVVYSFEKKTGVYLQYLQAMRHGKDTAEIKKKKKTPR